MLSPFKLRVEPDEEYHAKIADGLLMLLEEVERIEKLVRRENHELVNMPTSRDTMRWD